MNAVLTPRFLTPELAEDVVGRVLQATLLSKEWESIIRHPLGHIIILVPSLRNVLLGEHPDWLNAQVEPYLLFEKSLGPTKDWLLPYDEIARSKSLQLWQSRNEDGQTDSNAHLLFKGDTLFWGGVKRHGLVVSFSGVQPWFDQMISGMVADMLKAMGREALENSADKKENRAFAT